MKIKIMPAKDPNNFDWLSMLFFLILTAFGAIAKSALLVIQGNHFYFTKFICQLIISMFAGTIAILMVSSWGWTFEYTGCLAGCAGWLGADMVDAIASRFKKQIENKP